MAIYRKLTVANKSIIHIDYTKGSNAQNIEFEFVDYTIPVGARAFFYVRKPSGLIVYNQEEISGQKVIVKPTLQMTAEGGTNGATLAIMDGKKVLASFPIVFEIAQSYIDPEAVESTNEFDLVTQEIADAIAAAERAAGSVTAAAAEAERAAGSVTAAAAAAERAAGSVTAAAAEAKKAAGYATQAQEQADRAETAKTNIDASVSAANSALQSLSNENASAVSNLEELRSENFNSQEILAGVANLEAYLGITTDVAGLCVDYENKTFTRLAGAVGLSAGSDFDKWKMYGGRKRCNVADDGTILAYYGDANYKEDGSNGQVMVYQPKFYYLVAPINYDVQETGIGYHLRKANYYVSEKARTGFRLHPAFYDVNGNQVDYILMGAYEACLYDTSASEYITDDAQVMTVGEDKLSSIAGVKPVSGSTQNLTRPNVETLAQNRGSNWHGSTVKIASMNQLLCMIEMGTMNFQSAIGQGVVSYASGSGNEASNTGATSSLGNGTGQATQTTHISSDGTETIDTTSGKLSVSYRGLENPWGNIWEFEYGVNIWGNGNMAGGEPYVADDFNFAESKRTDNYEGAGFTVTNANGYISAMGYSTRCDWLFMASETAGNSSLPVGDYTYVISNLNGYRIARLGGYWYDGANAGGFYWGLNAGVGFHYRYIGGRLVYVPTTLL